jgi:hypothetical protein
MASVLGLMILGLIITVFKTRKEVHMYKQKREDTKELRKKRESARTIALFMNDCLPLEFTGLPWWKRWWEKSIVEHDWVGMFLPFDPERGVAWAKFLVGMGKVVNFMFIDAILAGLFFHDDGTCGSFKSENSCGFLRSLDQVDPLCIWSFDQDGYDAAISENHGHLVDADGVKLTEFFGTCSFNELGEDFVPLLIVTIILTTLTVPFDKLVEYLVANIAALFESTNDDTLEDDSLSTYADCPQEVSSKNSNDHDVKENYDLEQHLFGNLPKDYLKKVADKATIQ